MSTLKIKWEAKGKGTLEYSFDDLGITKAEWDSLSDQEKELNAIDLIDGDDETIVYGNLRSFKVVDGD